MGDHDAVPNAKRVGENRRGAHAGGDEEEEEQRRELLRWGGGGERGREEGREWMLVELMMQGPREGRRQKGKTVRTLKTSMIGWSAGL